MLNFPIKDDYILIMLTDVSYVWNIRPSDYKITYQFL